MNEMSYYDLVDAIKSGTISPYQFYNTDIDYPQYFGVNHFLANPNDNIDKHMKLNTAYFDIEVYTKDANEFPYPSQAKYPINSLSFRFKNEKTYVANIMPLPSHKNIFAPQNIPKIVEYFEKTLRDNKYIDEDEHVEVRVFNREYNLIKDMWDSIHINDPATLSTWNGDSFDIPYIYQRLCNITDDSKGAAASKVMSKFAKTKRRMVGRDLMVDISDYTSTDLMYLYKPRDEGGLNYGKKMASYSLDWVADAYLKLKKLEYKSAGGNLNTFYEQDPINFLLYNIIDSVLLKKLDDKLQHIDAHNLMRRLMKTPFNMSTRGPSALFDTMSLYNLQKDGKYVRFGLVQETAQSISVEQVKAMPRPKDKTVKWTVDEVTEAEFRKILSRYPGAYVKDGLGKTISLKDGQTIDMDNHCPFHW